jgi:hypothetical protein
MAHMGPEGFEQLDAYVPKRETRTSERVLYRTVTQL